MSDLKSYLEEHTNKLFQEEFGTEGISEEARKKQWKEDKRSILRSSHLFKRVAESLGFVKIDQKVRWNSRKRDLPACYYKQDGDDWIGINCGDKEVYINGDFICIDFQGRGLCELPFYDIALTKMIVLSSELRRDIDTINEKHYKVLDRMLPLDWCKEKLRNVV